MAILTDYMNIDGLIPGVKGQRPFPTIGFRETDPFLLLDQIGPQQVGINFFLDGTGHDHPHRGFETLSIILQGGMNHKDSLGNKVFLKSGDIQLMNAGKGIIHGGDMYADPESGLFHEVQLWINNPGALKLSEPGIQNVKSDNIPVHHSENLTLRIFSGTINLYSGTFKNQS